MRVLFDFDGTLASWPTGIQAHYDDARQSVIDSAARVGPIRYLKHLATQGHDVAILTGRGAHHAPWILLWLHTFTGRCIRVITRPGHVGLSCESQAAWKASILRDVEADVYVGDNFRIDAEAARLAGVHYIDARRLMVGEFPELRRSA